MQLSAIDLVVVTILELVRSSLINLMFIDLIIILVQNSDP